MHVYSYTSRLVGGWRNIKHTGKYTDPVTHTACTHMLNQRLMFCQGLRLYPPSAKNKCFETVVEKITFEEFISSTNYEKGEMKCSFWGQETLPFCPQCSYRSQMNFCH